MQVGQSKPDRGAKLIPLVTILGSLAVILTMINSLRQYLSESVQIFVISIFIIYLLITIYVFSYDWISKFVIQKRLNYKHNLLAIKYFPEFKNFTQTFSEFIEKDNNIPKVLNKLRSDQMDFRYLFIPQLHEVNNLSYSLDLRTKCFNKTSTDFELIIKQFENILRIYDKFWLNQPVQDVVRIGKDVPANIKSEYLKCKLDYEQFLKNYIQFGKKVNREFGTKIFSEYLEYPQDL